MGPSICSGDGTSEGWMKAMVNGTHEKIPRAYIGFCDVRDVALAHLKAIQVAEAVNKRFLICTADMNFRDVANVLAPVFNPKGYKVPTVDAEGEDPTGVRDSDNSRSREILGLDYTEYAKTMIDMVNSLIDSGKLKPSE
jgi:nucleoside-diphosphate-sugar epimerase